MSIRSKLISILLLISLVPIIFLSIIGVEMDRVSLREKIGSKLENMAIEKAHTIQAILNSKIEETVILATHPMIINALRKANGRYSNILDVDALDSILAIDREWIAQKGKTKTASSISTTPLSAFFGHYQDRVPKHYGEIFVTDKRGGTVAMTTPLSDYYQADEDWWKEGFANGKGAVFIDDRGYDESAGGLVVGAVVPVKDGDEIIGILKINFKLTDVLDVINGGVRHESIVGTIARNSGSLVIAPGETRPRTTTGPENIILKETKGGWITDTHFETKTIMGYAPISVPIFSHILPTGSEKGVKGETWHKTIWFTLLDENQNDAFAPLQTMTTTYFISGLIAILVVIIVALRLASNISRPIRRLHQGAQAISEGDFSYRLSIEREDEIGGLARAFTKMTSELSDVMAAQRKLAQSIEQSPSLMFITDTEGNIEYANKQFYVVTGYSPEEVIGQNPRLLQSGRTPLALYQDLWKTIKKGDIWRGEMEDKCKNGQIFCADVTITSIRSESGHIINFSVSHVDITLRKKAQTKMIAAKEQAVVANRAKSDLMANMSHELRTPLNAIIGFSSSIKEEVFGPIGNDKYLEYVDDINYSGQHLLELINDILDVSAIEAGAVELHEEDVNICNIINASVRIIRHRAKKGGVVVTSSVNSNLPMIHVDVRRLKQIILNLLSNAVKFTPPDGEVTVDSWLNDEGTLTISIADTGIGMNKKEVAKAMTSFGQVDSGLNRKHEGTGLGLPLTKGLVELHGGVLDVKSKKGKGTIITVTLPKKRIAKD